jgi:heme exporter protein A
MISSDPPPPIPLLQAEGLAFARNDEPVFGPLDFTLNPGDVVLVEGDNGSGKTTLLKVLSGLLTPDSGRIRLNGEDLTLARLSHQVALLGHLGGLKLDLTALENLRFAIGVFGLRSGAAPLPALASVGLEGYERAGCSLSAGPEKRVLAPCCWFRPPCGCWTSPMPTSTNPASTWSIDCSMRMRGVVVRPWSPHMAPMRSLRGRRGVCR